MTFHAGQPFRPSASRENEIEKMLRDYRAGRLRYETKEKEPMPLGHMLAKNDTGDDLGFGVVRMYELAKRKFCQGNQVNPDWDPRLGFLSLRQNEYILSQPLTGTTVEWGGIAITTEPILRNSIGRVAVSGLAILPINEEIANDCRNSRYILPTTNSLTGFSCCWFGFARVIQIAENNGLAIVDLSDRYMQARYGLLGNYSNKQADAVIQANTNVSWMTKVYDLHELASFQRKDSSGWCTWYGSQWVVTVPFC